MRFDATTNTASNETLILWAYCEPNRTHAVGDLQFGPDGSLYLSHGDSAWGSYVNYGQSAAGRPVNQCGDANRAIGVAPTLPNSEGGMLRAQDLRTSDDPAGLQGTLIRIDPNTGAAAADNPHAGSADPNEARIVAYGLRQPFRFTFRPGTDDTYIADVGWKNWEEINRVPNPRARVDATDPDAQRADNFGWPCYEGPARLAGVDALDATICESLYADTKYPARSGLLSYQHDSKTVAGGSCPAGGQAANGGIAFYEGLSYPAAYRGALFFADYARECVYAIAAGPGGIPDPAHVLEVIAATGVVDLESGPGGDLYFVDILAGTINRLTTTNGTAPPVALLTADPTTGAVPLTVTFDASGSTDPSGGGLTFAWDHDGDGTIDATTTTSISAATFNTAGALTPSVTITDSQGRTAGATVNVHPGNTKPVATIHSPSAVLEWAVGDSIIFSGSASDVEDGALADGQLKWSVFMNHCPGVSECHRHVAGGGTGATTSVTIPEHEMKSWIEATLTATDAFGSAGSTTVRLNPQTVRIRVSSSPQGAPVSVNDAQARAPFDTTVIKNSTATVTAAASFDDGNDTHEFVRWNTANERTLTITATADTDLIGLYVTADTDLIGPYVTDKTSIPPYGYWVLGTNGDVYPFGDAEHHGDASASGGVIAIGIVPTPSNQGYWILHADGHITAHGDAIWHGDLSDYGQALSAGEHPTVMAPTPKGDGYWIFTNNGRVIALGAARHHGDLLAFDLEGGIVAAAATPSGGGYLLVASDGGVFALGDAEYRGSVPAVVAGPLNQPIVGVAVAPNGSGYWLVGSDGGVFAFGAPYRGSLPAVLRGPLNEPVDGMVPYGDGYLLVASDGGVFVFSDRPFAGSLGAEPPTSAVIAIAALS